MYIICEHKIILFLLYLIVLQSCKCTPSIFRACRREVYRTSFYQTLVSLRTAYICISEYTLFYTYLFTGLLCSLIMLLFFN